MMIVIQTLKGAGMALLYGFFYPHVTATRALYITTGAPTLALIPLGFVMLPGTVAEQKLEAPFDYIWSLPHQEAPRPRPPSLSSRCWPSRVRCSPSSWRRGA